MSDYTLIRGEKNYYGSAGYCEGVSHAYVNSKGEVKIHKAKPLFSFRSVGWQKAYYDRCEKIGDAE